MWNFEENYFIPQLSIGEFIFIAETILMSKKSGKYDWF
jgi:hypothetical protein